MSKMYKVKVDGNVYEVEVEFLSENATSIPAPQVSAPAPIAPVATAPSGKGEPIVAPMQGNIWKIVKNVGDVVKAGDTILILEAMKMENNIVAPKDGTIVSIVVKEGDAVNSGATLAELA